MTGGPSIAVLQLWLECMPTTMILIVSDEEEAYRKLEAARARCAPSRPTIIRIPPYRAGVISAIGQETSVECGSVFVPVFFSGFVHGWHRRPAHNFAFATLVTPQLSKKFAS